MSRFFSVALRIGGIIFSILHSVGLPVQVVLKFQCYAYSSCLFFSELYWRHVELYFGYKVNGIWTHILLFSCALLYIQHVVSGRADFNAHGLEWRMIRYLILKELKYEQKVLIEMIYKHKANIGEYTLCNFWYLCRCLNIISVTQYTTVKCVAFQEVVLHWSVGQMYLIAASKAVTWIYAPAFQVDVVHMASKVEHIYFSKTLMWAMLELVTVLPIYREETHWIIFFVSCTLLFNFIILVLRILPLIME